MADSAYFARDKNLWKLLSSIDKHNVRTKIQKLYLLRSYSSREPFSKSECANIVQATEKVEVALDSLVNGLKDSLSDKMC